MPSMVCAELSQAHHCGEQGADKGLHNKHERVEECCDGPRKCCVMRAACSRQMSADRRKSASRDRYCWRAALSDHTGSHNAADPGPFSRKFEPRCATTFWRRCLLNHCTALSGLCRFLCRRGRRHVLQCVRESRSEGKCLEGLQSGDALWDGLSIWPAAVQTGEVKSVSERSLHSDRLVPHLRRDPPIRAVARLPSSIICLFCVRLEADRMF